MLEVRVRVFTTARVSVIISHPKSWPEVLGGTFREERKGP